MCAPNLVSRGKIDENWKPDLEQTKQTLWLGFGGGGWLPGLFFSVKRTAAASAVPVGRITELTVSNFWVVGVVGGIGFPPFFLLGWLRFLWWW